MNETYLIAGHEDEGEALFWSNDDGWVDRASATRFSYSEKTSARLPMGGRWVSLSEIA